MFGRIIVPLDGSPFAEAALPAAATLAERFEASIRLLHVRPRQWNDDLEEVERSLDQEGRGYLANVGTQVRGMTAADVAGQLRHGNAVDEILAAADGPDDIIVMTSHGRGGLPRLWLGSIADAVIRRSERPVLVVRTETKAAAASSSFRVGRVIVPLDGSALAEASLPIAVLWAEAFGAQVVLLTCVRELIYGDSGFVPAAYWLPLPPGEGAVDARAYLDGIAQRVRSSRVEAVVQVVSGFDAARAVRDAAVPDDIIVMATHGHGGLRRALLGSVADEVIREAAGAVLVIRPAAPVEQSDEEIEATRREPTTSTTSGA